MEKFRASDGKELAYLRFDPKNEAKAFYRDWETV